MNSLKIENNYDVNMCDEAKAPTVLNASTLIMNKYIFYQNLKITYRRYYLKMQRLSSLNITCF